MQNGQLYRGLTRPNPWLATADDLTAVRPGVAATPRLAEKLLAGE